MTAARNIDALRSRAAVAEPVRRWILVVVRLDLDDHAADTIHVEFAPISSGATSCGLRVRSITEEPWQGERRHDAADDAREAAGDNREAQ